VVFVQYSEGDPRSVNTIGLIVERQNKMFELASTNMDRETWRERERERERNVCVCVGLWCCL